MKKFLLFVFVLAMASLSGAASTKPGEKVYYNVSQMGLKVGEATMTFEGFQTYQGKNVVLISFYAKGFNFLDSERIYLDPQSYKPVAVLRDLNIFGKKEKIEEIYTPGKVTITKNAGGKASQQIIDKTGQIDNIYAFIYWYRQMGKFTKNDRFSVHLPTKDVSIKMVKQTSLNAAGKRYDAFYLESDPAKYKLWFDASEDKIPLRISGAIGLANTTMIMTRYEK